MIDLEVSASFVDCYVVDPVVDYEADQMVGVVVLVGEHLEHFFLWSLGHQRAG